ncbi:helix-turn-helix domain-containing protein [Gemmobacter nectariphilus]|uniref:helix-turn-helix domain-containing protein n=1 Tax=Gemmobacter nectariphilus TaxID=220343 RepID=UPI000403E1D2|nr:helix-turn-helix domain-containing protein [Gemmobacter nectariphilus]
MAEVVKLHVDAAEAARLRALWANVVRAEGAPSLPPDAGTVPEIEADLQALKLVLMPETAMEPILAKVSESFGVPVRVMLGARRQREVVNARWAAIWLGRKAGLTLEQIGRAMRMDHTSVIHALKKVQNLMEAANA